MYDLIGDIGGTNCRLATLNKQTGKIASNRTYQTKQFRDLASAVAHFKLDIGACSFTNACVAIANPVSGDRVSMTNSSWEFSIRETQTELQLGSLSLINDWEAIGYALPDLSRDRVRPLASSHAVKNPVLSDEPAVLAGVGTGLGAAIVVPGPGGQVIPVAGESGHMSYSPTEDIDIDILRYLMGQFGHVSFERLLSGPGLQNIKNALETITSIPSRAKSPAEIVESARSQSDPISEQTLHIFARTLGSFVGNLALVVNAKGGIYLGGGVLDKIGSAFCVDSFRNGLTNKGRLGDALANTPVYLMEDETLALTGCVNYLRSHAGS